MNTWMDGSYFNLSYKYALTMSIFACWIMYWGPIPILIPVCGIYFLWQYWIDKIFFLRLNKIPNYYSQSIHNAMIRVLPLWVILHCIFSMWAYGSPEMWPEGFIEDGKNSKGMTKYTFKKRSFSERLFNENSLPFFILFIIFSVAYLLENILISYVFRKLFKKLNSIDEKQPNFSEIKERLADWTLSSYDPSLNLKYSKIMAAIEDVAEENEDFELAHIKSK